MYLPSHSPSHPRALSPPRAVATAAATAAASAHHNTNDVRRRLRVELHHQQPHHQRVVFGDAGRSGGSRYQHFGGGESSARKVAAVAAIQKELSKLDGGGAASAAGGLSSTTSGRSGEPASAASTVAAPPSSSLAAATALPLTIGMGMLRTSSAGSLSTLVRAGKRQLPSSSSSSPSSGPGASDSKAAMNVAGEESRGPCKVHISSHKKQEMDDGGRRPAPAATASLLGAGLGVGIYAASSSVSSITGTAAGGRRNRSCSDLSSALIPQAQALRLATTTAAPASSKPAPPPPPQQLPPPATNPSRFAGLTTTLATLLAAPRGHAPPQPAAGRHCGAASIKGRKAARPLWTNQDSFLFVEWGGEAEGDAPPPQGLVGMYAVMDGHGDVGHRVSQHCRERLPQVMMQVRPADCLFVVQLWTTADDHTHPPPPTSNRHIP